MYYKVVSIAVSDQSLSDVLVARLSDEGYDGFEEKDGLLIAYIPYELFDNEVLKSLCDEYTTTSSVRDVEKINWNREWEENFQPVIVDDFCTIRADFHTIEVCTEHEIIITPKMSFGTGHHATTQLMIRMMRHLETKDRSVLDFGTGTGILAILASKLSAKSVTAIDNEDWAYENAQENAERNGISNIEFALGALELYTGRYFDIILANINRHILLQYMDSLYRMTARGGIVLMSGLLEEDRTIIVNKATHSGFHFLNGDADDKWIALLFSK